MIDVNKQHYLYEFKMCFWKNKKHTFVSYTIKTWGLCYNSLCDFTIY